MGKSSGEIDGMQEPLIDGVGSSENYSVAAAILPLVSLLRLLLFHHFFGAS